MPAGWERALAQIRRDRRSGASVLLARGIEAARLFLSAMRHAPWARLDRALEEFTWRLVECQPSMAAFLTLANALWIGRGGADGGSFVWGSLHDALVQYAEQVDRGLRETIRRTAALVRTRSLVLTYSNSAAVRMGLWRAMAAGRRFEVVCSESRPMHEGQALARQLAGLGIPVHLVVDAALPEWVPRADLILLGADAVMADVVVNKVGTEPILQAARRAGLPTYVLADSSKWLTAPLAGLWRMREEAVEEITDHRHPNLAVHNRYFDRSALRLVTGLVWEGGVARPREVRRRIGRLVVSAGLVELLGRRPGSANARASGPH